MAWAPGFFHTQIGFNDYLLGDDATSIAPPSGFGYELNTVSVMLGFQVFADGRYGTNNVHDYTPALQLNVYAIDPVSRLPLDVDNDPTTFDYLPPIATATRSDVTFTPTVNVLDSDLPLATAQTVVFTFAPGTILPADFAFGYRDNLGVAADGNRDDEVNFLGIIGTNDTTAASIGSTVYGSELAYANSPPGQFVFNGFPAANDGNASYEWSVNNNAFATVTGTLVELPVPEPASLGLIAAGGLLVLRRRRSA